ncbi:MAG: XdhC family protein [Pseudomonadota bacterium]
MTERRQLLAMLDRLPLDDEVVLATVVKVEGSAYRRPGARMLIPRYGRSVGTLSGGCLESEVSKKAWYLTEGGRAVVCRYSTASLSASAHGDQGGTNPDNDNDAETDAESELAFGLGCNGTVHVLLQRLPVTAPLFARLRAVEQGRAPAAQAIVIGKSGEWGANIGDTVAIGSEVVSENPAEACADRRPADPALASAVQAELTAVLAAGQSRLLRYRRADGAELEWLLELLPPRPELVIIGAGHDAEPLVRLAALMGWRVTVVDGRAHFARPERFPDADQVLCLSVADAARLPPVTRSVVVVMSHSFSQDRDWLRHFLHQSPLYLGQLGPKSRTDRLLGELAASDDPSLHRAIRRLRAPVGLDLGGSTPEAVALAILAEAQAALTGRLGGPLADRGASIHQNEPVAERTWPG